MKPVIPRLAGVALMAFFPLLFFKKAKMRFVLLFLLMMLFASCFQKYYRTNTVTQADETAINNLRNSQKYFILHLPQRIISLSDLSVHQDTLSAVTGEVSKEHFEELDPNPEKANVFKAMSKEAVLSEVHLYSKINDTSSAGSISLPLKEIYRMDVYGFDKGKTTGSTVKSFIGLTVVTALAVAGIAAASSGGDQSPPPPSSGGGGDLGGMSCPMVFIKQGDEYSFNNVLYPGSIVSNLERTDYLPLGKLPPQNGIMNVRLQSSNKEIQYINMVKLITVNHSDNAQILADKKGRIFITGKPDALVSAHVPGGKDLKSLLMHPDDKSYDFSVYNPAIDFSQALLKFRKPGSADKARLIIRARADIWTTQMHQEFANLSGENYPAFRAFRERTDSVEMHDWFLKQGFPLRVYIKNGKDWNYVDYFPVPGLESYRDMVMEIPLPKNNETFVEFRLETGLRFWDLDYAALDYSVEKKYSVLETETISVQHCVNGDIKKQVSQKDNAYAILNVSEYLDLEFKVPQAATGKDLDYILIAGGYYHDQLTYPGKPDIERVTKFNNDGEFDRFSREKYAEYMQLVNLAKKY